jgi:hypothetical protein
MFIVSNWLKCLGMALGCLFLIFAASCGSETQYIGVYKAQDPESQKQSEIELKSDSEGVWRGSIPSRVGSLWPRSRTTPLRLP